MNRLEHKFVVYVDILGFSKLTLENELQIENIRDNEGPAFRKFEKIFQENRKDNDLTAVFSNFHSVINGAIMLARLECDFSSAVFSDSAFIATKHLNHALSIGANLMSNFLSQKVPVRGGISYGAFESIRFRSDIMPGSSEHASYFLGSGVVKAVQVESSGLKGLRMFIHPEVSTLVRRLQEKEILQIEEYVQDIDSSEMETKIGIYQELNYWKYNISGEKKAWVSFQELWKKAGEAFSNPYEKTARAIQKMRTNRGYLPIPDLKRLTIKRK